MRRPSAPADPAGYSPRTARALLASIAVLVLVATLTAGNDAVIPGAGSAALVGGFVEGIRHGDGFYALAAGAVGGVTDTPVLSVPLPTLAIIAAALPWAAITAMLWTLAGAVVVAWQPHLRRETRGKAQYFAAVAGVIGGCAAILRPSLALAPELWAGLLIALSLARRRPGDPVEAIAFSLAATLLAPEAALYPLLMAALAWRDGRRREAAGWLTAILLLAIVLAAHAHALLGLIDGSDADAGPAAGLAAAAAIAAVTVIAPLPPLFSAPLVALALAGWLGWRDEVGRRSAATLIGFAMLVTVAATPDHGDGWALFGAPIALIGLAFIPDVLRDLTRAALDRRRITVRRVAR